LLLTKALNFLAGVETAKGFVTPLTSVTLQCKVKKHAQSKGSILQVHQTKHLIYATPWGKNRSMMERNLTAMSKLIVQKRVSF